MPESSKHTVWLFALGFLIFYTPYAALSKAVTAGVFKGVPKGLVGMEILPAAILGTVFTIPLIITLAGWWRYANFRRFLGIPVPVTTPAVALSGFGLALIIASTTVAFTFQGISIVLALLLMRGGLLIMGPVVDTAYVRKVRWFSWTALAISLCALTVSLSAVNDYALPLLAVLNLGVYLTGYALRTPCMTHLAKVNDTDTTRAYFVQEVLVTICVLPLLPLTAALFGTGASSLALRRGFTTFWTMHPAAVLPVVMIGVFYACHNIFGTLIYLDRRENTFSVPLFCGVSFLAGFSAVSLLSRSAGLAAPPLSQMIASAMILSALVLLSPAHHWPQRMSAFLRGRLPLRGTAVVAPHFVLFVCSGNTCRSPMAAALANAEIALRLGMPLDDVLRGRVRAESGGLEPRLGRPMDAMSLGALQRLSIAVSAHEARPITPDQIVAADVIYCMTETQRTALAQQYPSAVPKARCLDPERDIAEPAGQGHEVYLDVARRIQTLVRMHFDEAGLVGA
jgi:protein-tyrosine-phosphatase